MVRPVDPSTVVLTPTLTLDPASGLADGDTVTLTGSGFRPGSFVDTSLCVGDPTARRCRWLDAWGEVDAAGEVTVEARVFALVVVWNDESEETVDCRTSAEPCTIVLSPGNVGSVRAGSAPLLFDPDAPLLPAPEIELTPATDLADDATVTVSGRNFTAGGYASLAVCGGGGSDPTRCDESASSFSEVDADGAFTVEMALSPTLSTWDGQAVDCRAEACAIVATDELRGRTATASLTFAPEAPPVHRYLDPVFDEVSVTRDVVFRDVTDAAGNPVQLTADIYEPAGDTAAKRPAVVWMTGGWFDRALDMAAYADAFARRGYVAVTMDYRARPGFSCCPTRDALGVTAALVDVHDDATHGVMWLREHAAEHRIDPDAIAAGGAQAGAVAAYGLAFRPGESHHGPAEVAAALPIGGMSLGEPGDEGAPVLAFHGADDLLAPTHLSDWTCADADHMDVTCEVVEYPNTGGQLAVSRQRDIVRRSAEFLATNVLEPLGYDVGPVDPAPPVDPPAEPPAAPNDPPGGGTGTPGTPGPGTGSGQPGDPGAGRASGRLPKTGSDPLPLLQVGILLAATGAALVTAAGWRRRRGLAAIPVGAAPCPGGAAAAAALGSGPTRAAPGCRRW